MKNRKPWIIAIIILVVIFGGVFAFNLTRTIILKRVFANFQFPPSVVSTITVKAQDWQPLLPSVGELSAYKGISVSAEVSGRVTDIYFTAGQKVKAGEKLVQLDDASEKAQLSNMEAQLRNAELNFKRYSHLLEQKAVSQGAYDDAASSVKQLRASYDNLVASKEKKLIKAPFSGTLGIPQIKLGEVINAGQTCVSLQTVDALYVTFSVSQKDYSYLTLQQPVNVTVDAYPDEVFHANVAALDSNFSDDSHTIEVQAALKPSKIQLLPGMFVDVDILLPIKHDVIVVPQTALSYTLYGESAYLVSFEKENKDGKEIIATDKNGFKLGRVKKVFVKTVDKRGNLAVVTEGLNPGDIIVEAGQNKIENGSRVAINNSMDDEE